MTTGIIPALIYYFFSCLMHPFHVSICEIVHNEKNRTLEITMKMFTDDLENALKAYSQQDFSINDQVNQPVSKTIIETYLEEKFSVWLNDQPATIHYLGAETDADALWCFLEVHNVHQLHKVRIMDAVIMEFYRDQVNLVHLESRGKIKSLQLHGDYMTGDLAMDP